MKIRNGFISNSSSASYLVKIKASMEDFTSKILEQYSWNDYFYKERFEESVREDIEELKENLKQKCTETQGFFYDRKKDLKKSLKNKEVLLRKLKKLKDIEFVKVVLEYFGIKVSSSSTEIFLNQETVMHNDFNTGMCDLFRELVLFFMFDTKYKVECKRED